MLVGKEFLSSKTLKEIGDNTSNYLLQMFKAQGCTLTATNKEGMMDNTQNKIVCTGLSTLGWEKYTAYYCKLDPLLRAPYTPYPHRVYITSDVIDVDTFERSEFYNEFLKPLSIRSHLFICLGSPGNFVGTLTLIRDTRSQWFSSADKSLALLLEPYLTAAFEKAQLIEQNLGQEFVINSLLEKVPGKGIVVLDPSFRPVHRNLNSEAILSMFYRPGESRETLPPCLVRAFQSRTSETAKDVSSFEAVPPGASRKVRVTVRRASGTAGKPYVLLFFELEHDVLFLSRQLKQYDLTVREVEIVSCVCRGMRNSDIAERLYISEHTVANHMSHIFEKLRINSRTGLLRLVLEPGL
jgi:DNA-binding CsgD family transcriptional regulator